MTLLTTLVDTSLRVGSSSSRLKKVRELADCLRTLAPEEVDQLAVAPRARARPARRVLVELAQHPGGGLAQEVVDLALAGAPGHADGEPGLVHRQHHAAALDAALEDEGDLLAAQAGHARLGHAPGHHVADGVEQP